MLPHACMERLRAGKFNISHCCSKNKESIFHLQHSSFLPSCFHTATFLRKNPTRHNSGPSCQTLLYNVYFVETRTVSDVGVAILSGYADDEIAILHSCRGMWDVAMVTMVTDQHLMELSF